MKTTKVFSGNEFTAVKKAIPAYMQVSFFEDDFFLNIFPEHERKRGAGVKQQILVFSKQELEALANNIKDIIQTHSISKL